MCSPGYEVCVRDVDTDQVSGEETVTYLKRKVILAVTINDKKMQMNGINRQKQIT